MGQKDEIYKLLHDLAQQGKSIILISSELPEILRISHRVIVMCEGKITGELKNDEKCARSDYDSCNKTYYVMDTNG